VWENGLIIEKGRHEPPFFISVTLQRDTERQFLNIPPEFELAANEVFLTQDGHCPVLTPIKVDAKNCRKTSQIGYQPNKY
jgi:virulence-associated protein VagC